MQNVIQRSVSVPANSSIENIISGNQFEFLDRDSLLAFGFTQSAAGLEVTGFLNQRTIFNGVEPIVKATSPIIPDDNVAADVPGIDGERIIIPVTNTTAGALTLRYTVRIQSA